MATNESFRWSVNRAAGETGFARQTIANYLAASQAKPGEDGCYSTQEIMSAIYGDMDGEKLRKIRAEADLAEMERDERNRSLIPAPIVEAVWLDVMTNLRGVVLAFEMSKEQRHQLIKLLRAIPISEYTEAKLQSSAEDGPSDA